MGAKSSLVILNEFLLEHKIKADPKKHLKKHIVDSDRTIQLQDDIVARIIADAYDITGEKIREIDTLLQEKIEFYLGRVQKEQLKKYLAYSDPDDLQQLISLTRDESFAVEGKKICEEEVLPQKEITDAVDKFLSKLKQAIEEKNDERVQDYLVFIYSRLLAKNENRELSLKQLFDNNAQKYLLSKSQYKSLETFCKSEKLGRRFGVINKYNSKYLDILEQDEKNQDKSSVIYLNITPKLYRQFKSKEGFYNALFSFIKTAYDELKNHRSLVVKVQNIIVNEINIKWEIYSYLSIFAEKFIKREEKQQYYFPEILCKEFLEHRYQKEITSEDVEQLKQYYRGKISFVDLQKNKNLNQILKTEIDEFKHIYTGFTFIDCSILLSEKPFENSNELSFMQNKTELLLLFFKHEIDPRKIPCPVCGSLIISGNSFPELGIRSWECKNPLCSERSKTNRGKRYSTRTIFMQNSRFDFSKENTIEKTLIKKWRKDVVEKHSTKSLYNMITKYFSLVGDNITIIDAESPKQFEKIIKNEKRCVKSFNFKKFAEKIDHNLYQKFFEKSSEFKFIDHFLHETNYHKSRKISVTKFPTIIQGDCNDVLENMGEVHNMVTSPPYYNAREYSEWVNLYIYLHEMYLAAKGSFQALQKGGVFFFNIGDIFDNEKIIVKSKMGGKRIPLGAYIILLFQKAGFELLDNIIWDKGEPQTNRHKNDGNNVPYYQRPANCYEHIFIFKKPGAKLKLNENKKQLIDSNYQKFVPVYKIGPGGINRYGHTAPFPENVPLLSLQCFTNEGEIVLDPFLGSGTSIIVAEQYNRKGLGIELMDEYVQLSSKRAKDRGISIEIIDSQTGEHKKATKEIAAV